MRLVDTTLVVLAGVLLATSTNVSKADQTSVSDVDVSHSSHEDTIFLRSHQTMSDQDKLSELDGEERKFGENMFAALKLQRMKSDDLYRLKVFQRWKKHEKSAADVSPHVPESLYEKYQTFLRMWN